jgi:hypothetical protein
MRLWPVRRAFFRRLLLAMFTPPSAARFPVDFKMFIVDKKQNQCAIADAAIASAGR